MNYVLNNDLHNYISDSIMLLKNNIPVYVSGVCEGKLEVIPLGSCHKYLISVDKFSFMHKEIGYCTDLQGKSVYLSEENTKSWKFGMSFRRCLHMTRCSFEELKKSILGRYNSYYLCLKNGGHWHKNWAYCKGMLMYKGITVGDKDGLFNKYIHLKEEFNESKNK